jgi:hypothetical protein
MSLPIYQRVAVTDAGDVIPGAEYTVINENTGVAAPIYSDRTGATLLTSPYFANSVGVIQFYIAQGTTYRVAASGGVGTYTDRYVYGVSSAVFVDTSGNVNVDGTVTADGLVVDGDAAINVSTAEAGVTLTLNGNRSSDADVGSIFFKNNGDSVGLIRSNRAGSNDAADMIFYTQAAGGSNSERMQITSTGDLLVGKTSNVFGDVGTAIRSPSEVGSLITLTKSGENVAAFNRLASAGSIVTFNNDSTIVGFIGAYSSDAVYIGSDDVGLVFRPSLQSIYPVNGTSSSDNNIDLGYPTVRFNDAYITNGVTTGSDQTQKQDILEITTAEYNVAKACKGLLRSYRWIDAVEKKGDDARIHFGIMAQQLRDAFTAEGLDAGRYAMFMSNTEWELKTEVAAVEAVDEVTDENGNVTTEAVKAKAAHTHTDNFQTLAEAPEGAIERTQLGVRYTELLAFIIAAI